MDNNFSEKKKRERNIYEELYEAKIDPITNVKRLPLIAVKAEKDWVDFNKL